MVSIEAKGFSVDELEALATEQEKAEEALAMIKRVAGP